MTMHPAEHLGVCCSCGTALGSQWVGTSDGRAAHQGACARRAEKSAARDQRRRRR